ncbi:uncharacterized protein LOC117112998 [Anneissia japonica]|uniref:uncharacterized protein LOC117112998 n=1 Tax=Anneissia japonica TaxID=1529436 RepID=UPI0014255D62|nr:uncharacterized protein LOC117112998 [Anneissia japonica]
MKAYCNNPDIFTLQDNERLEINTRYQRPICKTQYKKGLAFTLSIYFIGDHSGIRTSEPPTTGASPTTGDHSSGRPTWQPQNTGASPNSGQQGSGPPQSAKFQSQSRPQANPQAHSHGTMFTSSNVGTNINIGPGTNIHSFSVSSGVPGHGNHGQFVYVPGGYGHGQGNSYPGPGSYGQAQENAGQDAYCFRQDVPRQPGYLPDEALMHICKELGSNWRMLGLNLGIGWNELEKIHCNFRKVEDAIMEMLMQWREQQPRAVNQLDKMCQALIAHQNIRLAEELRKRMK